ncbi:MAG: sugar phosphate nucleotidyltransferase [Spirochaetota bacterium]
MEHSGLEELTALQGLAGVTAAILAGGLGTRLRSVVADRPKVLAEVRGRPFLAFLLDQLADAGVRYVVLCTGYLGEQVQIDFGESYGSLRLVYSQESMPLGTAGALQLALPLFKSNTVLVMNGDSFCDEDLKEFLAWHFAKKAEATLLLTKLLNTAEYGRVNLNTNGLVLRFDEKSGNREPGWISAGIYLINHQLLLTISDSGFVSLERDIFPTWIGQGLYGYKSQARFLDIGTPETYAVAENFFTEEKL